MKVVMIHPHDINSLSEPWTIRIVALAKELVKKGVDVKLIYFPLKWEGYKNGVIDGVRVYPLPRMLGLNYVFSNIRRVVDIARDVDVIHFQKCFYHASIPAILAGFFLKKPIHYDWDDWETKIYHFGKPPSRLIGYFLNFMEMQIPKLVDSLTYSSDNLKKVAERVNSSLVMGKLPVGAYSELFDKNRDLLDVKTKYSIKDPLVLYLGQLHGAQYAELFVDAADKLSKEGVHAQYMIVGDGYLKSDLENKVKQIGLENKFIFTGSVKHNLVPSFLKHSSVAVACFEDNEITRSKSPLKIAEYMMAEKAIVASDVGEVGEMTGGCAWLVNHSDSISLADGIKKVLGDDSLRNSMQKKAKERSIEYTWEKSAGRLLSVYEKILS